MALARREALILGAIGAGAAVAGGLLGALALQAQSGAADLLATPVRDLSGARRTLREWRGRVVLCNFLATWGAPCREGIPMLVAVREGFAAKGAEIVGLGIDQAAKVEEIARTYGVTYPMLIAEADAIEVMRRLGNALGGLPYTVVVDRVGAVAHRRLGALTRAEVEGVLEGLLR